MKYFESYCKNTDYFLCPQEVPTHQINESKNFTYDSDTKIDYTNRLLEEESKFNAYSQDEQSIVINENRYNVSKLKVQKIILKK